MLHITHIEVPLIGPLNSQNWGRSGICNRWFNTHYRGVDNILNPGGAGSSVTGIICPPRGLNRVNWSAKFRRGSGTPGPHSTYTSALLNQVTKWKKLWFISINRCGMFFRDSTTFWFFNTSGCIKSVVLNIFQINLNVQAKNFKLYYLRKSQSYTVV